MVRSFLPPCNLSAVVRRNTADLEKAVRQGRSPEQEVGIIAQKVPEMSGSIVAHHTQLALGNLLGYELPMDGRIPRPGGRRVEVDGKKGVVHDPSPEEDAFDRWQKGEFLESRSLR